MIRKAIQSGMKKTVEAYNIVYGTELRIAGDDMSTREGRELARQGMDRAWKKEASQWKEEAWQSLCELAKGGKHFNADDIREIVGEGNAPNSMGALFSKAKRRGMIEIVGFRPMRNKRAHARTTFVYAGTGRGTDGV